MSDEYIHNEFEKDALFAVLSEAENLANVGGWEWDIVKNKWTFSDNWLRIHGFSKRHLDTSELLNIAHPDDRSDIQKAFDKAITENVPYEIEHRIIRQDTGEKRYVKAYGRGKPDSDGKVVKIYGAAQDITERKRMGEALREKIQFLQNIIDTTSELVSVTDMEGNFKFVGPSHSILGYKLDSLVGKNVMELVHPDDYPETATAFAEFLANKEDGRKVEYRCRRADGNFLWFETVGKFILDDAGNPKEILFSTRDVTKRNSAETELRRIEWMLSRKPTSIIEAQAKNHDQGYGDLTELNRDGIIRKSIGHERLKIFASDYLDLLGTSSAIYEINGDYAFGIFASGWCRTMDRASRNLCNTSDNVEALNSGRWLCHESCWTDCSKEVIAKGAEVDIACNGGIRMYAVPIFAGGNVIGVINFGYGDPPKDPEKLKMMADSYQLKYDDLLREATAYDSRPPYIIETAKKRLNSTAKLIGSMVEAKQAMEALRENENQISSIFRSAPVGIGSVVNRVLNKVNNRLCEMTGYDETELIGQSSRMLYPSDQDFEFVGREKYIQIANHGTGTVETRWQKKDGTIMDILLSSTPVNLKDKSKGVTFTALDITERKQAEEERENLRKQLNQAQKMESIGRLAGGVAHDFNNMLGVILGHTEMALIQTEQNHDLHADLKEIQKAAQRSADITKQLLAFARKQTISPKQLDLNDTVESMLNMLRRLIGEDIDLIWKPAAHLWPAKMDPTQIDQILANLCVNARDAISGVGKLTIETGKQTFDEEYCNEHPGFIPGDFLLLAVSDNGCGMDKETLDNLFEPFFTTKEVGKGTGLGLATIYGIVKQNNGFINIYSEPRQGSTFRIYLPRLIVDEDTDKALPEKKSAAGGTETILLVEDEPSILRMTRRMLERKGYTVMAASTPENAIEKAKNHSGGIDLLMTDVVMPEMNGRNLAGKITACYPGIRLLFMSGYTANVIAHQGVLDDGVAFIQKPFSMADMTAKVREILDKTSDKTQA